MILRINQFDGSEKGMWEHLVVFKRMWGCSVALAASNKIPIWYGMIWYGRYGMVWYVW